MNNRILKLKSTGSVNKYFFIISLMIIILSITFSIVHMIGGKQVKATNGILDLSNWDMKKDGDIELNGEWEVYYNKFLSPQDFENKVKEDMNIQKIPANWNSSKFDENSLNGYYIATYRLKIILPKNHRELGIKTMQINSLFKLYVDNNLVSSNWGSGNKLENTGRKFYQDTSYFTSCNREIEIVVQVAENNVSDGGITFPIFLGDKEYINHLKIYSVLMDFLYIVGVIYIYAYYAGLNWKWRKKPESLYFLVYCICIEIYAFTHLELISNYAISNMFFNYLIKVNTYSVIFQAVYILKYIHKLFGIRYSNKVKIIVNITTTILIILAMNTNLYFSHFFSNMIIGILILNSFLIIHILYKQLKVESQFKGHIYISIISLSLYMITLVFFTVYMAEINIVLPIYQQLFLLSFVFISKAKKNENIQYSSIENNKLIEKNNNYKSYLKGTMTLSTVAIDNEVSILIIDNDYCNLKIFSDILCMEKYDVTVCNNAIGSFDMLRGSLKYDLCILDANADGYELCVKIREKYSNLDLPILMLIEKTNSEDIVSGLNKGVNDFIEKPFEIEEIKYKTKTLVNLKKTTQMLLEKETAFLQAQIKPHFIFNALNTISSFCYTDSERAGEILDQLSIFLRNSFSFTNTSSFITIEKELELVNAYVAIEKARFGDRLKMQYNIDKESLEYKILPLTIQPIVENSIRHGILKRDDGGIVILEIKLIEDKIHIKIKDNGIGIPSNIIEDIKKIKITSESVGLKNINRRLNNFYGISLNIYSKKNQYTIVEFSIPLEI